MTIPKYVAEMMSRSRFAKGYGSPGYTIEIRKGSPYEYIQTLEKDISRLKKWVDKQMPHDEFDVPTMVINSVPAKTKHTSQYAVVTIYDPIMQQLEKYIPAA